MFMSSAIVLAYSLSLQNDRDVYLNNKPCQPYTLNHVITNEEMYNPTELIEKIFIQENGGVDSE